MNYFLIMLRLLAAAAAAAIFIFLLNTYLVLVVAVDKNSTAQLIFYVAVLAGLVVWIFKTHTRELATDGRVYAGIAAFIIRTAFWAVVLIGVVDSVISFLRVEGFLAAVVGKHGAIALGRPTFRGAFIHYPLLAVAGVIAFKWRGLGFVWLAGLVVAAQFLVVIFAFVFSYEQAFMGDLVRFWYAALFLFASSYTLSTDGHVRVDVLYARFGERGRAWVNAVGAVVLGLPCCWVILIYGLGNRGASLLSPLIGFEISQSGYGMYVKYLMAGFLVVFAVAMALQFIAVFLESVDKISKPRRWN